MRTALIESELSRGTQRRYPFSVHRVSAAARDIANRHGSQSIVPFANECWSGGSLFHLDDYFSIVFPAIRAEAFDLHLDQAIDEWRDAETEAAKAGHVSIASRAREIAAIDAKQFRSTEALETIAKNVLADCEACLREARGNSFSAFLRQIRNLQPLFYTLRDIFYELHFLAVDNEQKSDFVYLECFVDERHADIGQMVVLPNGGPVLGDILDWPRLSIGSRRRRLRFWQDSRVQLNHELAVWVEQQLSSLNSTAMANELTQSLGARMERALEEGQRLALIVPESDLSSGEQQE